jgi:hypothetical protein
MSSASYDYISNYIFIKKIIFLNIDKKLCINIIMKIDKKGKKCKSHTGKKLKINELRKECTVHNLKEHIIWALDEASYRSDNSIKISKDKIKSITVIS